MNNAYTISAHFGKKMSRDHNIRNRNITNSEDHIDPDGYFKIIEDRPIKQAYYKIFGQSVLEYNTKQTRSDRQIIDYHTKVLSAYNTIYIMTESLLLWSCRRLGLHPLFPKAFGKIHLPVGKGKLFF